MLSLSRILTYQPYNAPKKKDIPILLMPVFVFLLYIFNIIPCFFYKLDPYILIMSYSSTIAFRFVNPYISKVKGRKVNILYGSIIIMIFSGLLSMIGFFLVRTKDPQNLASLTNNFHKFITQDIIKYVFVGITEELICFYILLTFLALIKNKHKLFIGIIITSFIFGMLHGIGWPILCTLPIFLSHIPYIYSYNKFKSLLPAMIAHSLTDILVALMLVPGVKSPLIVIVQIVTFMLIMFSFAKFEAVIYD